MLKKINSDLYLRHFIEFCRKKYGKNLIGIGIYGSYVWGNFDKEKSDYDVFLIFKHKPKDKGEEIPKIFKRITLQYFCTTKELLDLVKQGHWSVYITLLTSARMFYHSNEYEEFTNQLRKIDFVENLGNVKRIEWKGNFNKEVMLKERGYNGAKYALPALRSRLQLLAYIKTRKLVWDLQGVIEMNKDFLTKKEQNFLIELDKSVRDRKNVFPNKKMAVRLSDKINKEILRYLKPVF